MAEPITITLQAGTVLLMLERGFAYFIAPRLRTPREQAERKAVTSGDQDPAYWQKEFRDASIEVNKLQVLPILESMAKTQASQNVILESMTRTMEGVAKLVEELVDISRKRRGR